MISIYENKIARFYSRYHLAFCRLQRLQDWYTFLPFSALKIYNKQIQD